MSRVQSLIIDTIEPTPTGEQVIYLTAIHESKIYSIPVNKIGNVAYIFEAGVTIYSNGHWIHYELSESEYDVFESSINEFLGRLSLDVTV